MRVRAHTKGNDEACDAKQRLQRPLGGAGRVQPPLISLNGVVWRVAQAERGQRERGSHVVGRVHAACLPA